MSSDRVIPGMYTIKTPHKWSGAVYLQGPYMEPHKEKLDSRFVGKQFITEPPKKGNTGMKGVVFSRFESSSGKGDVYQGGTTYIKSHPPEERKLGFGTHDAPRRDEFMDGQRAMQHKMAIQRETVSDKTYVMHNRVSKDTNPYDSKIEALEKKLGAIDEKYSYMREDLRHENDFAGSVTKYLYNIGRTQDGTTPTFLKDGREQFYSQKRCLHTQKKRHVHPLSTSSNDYGYLSQHKEALTLNKMADLVKKNPVTKNTGVGRYKIGHDDDF